jgi:hypothetical protein
MPCREMSAIHQGKYWGFDVSPPYIFNVELRRNLSVKDMAKPPKVISVGLAFLFDFNVLQK